MTLMRTRIFAVLAVPVVALTLFTGSPASASPVGMKTAVSHTELSPSECATFKANKGKQDCTITTVVTKTTTPTTSRSFSASAYVTTWTHKICLNMINNCSVYYGPGGWNFTQGGKYAWNGFQAWISSWNGISGTHWCRKESSFTYGASLQGCTKAHDPAGTGFAYGFVAARLRYEVCLGISKVSGCDVRQAQANLYPSGTITRKDY